MALSIIFGDSFALPWRSVDALGCILEPFWNNLTIILVTFCRQVRLLKACVSCTRNITFWRPGGSWGVLFWCHFFGDVFYRHFSAIVNNLVDFRGPNEHQSGPKVIHNEPQSTILGTKNCPKDARERFKGFHSNWVHQRASKRPNLMTKLYEIQPNLVLILVNVTNRMSILHNLKFWYD